MVPKLNSFYDKKNVTNWATPTTDRVKHSALIRFDKNVSKSNQSSDDVFNY